MDEDQNPTGEQQVEEQEVSQEQPGSEEQVENREEQEESQEEEISQDPVNQEEEQPKPTSRREQKRIDQLLEKLSQYEQGRTNERMPERQTGKQSQREQIIPEGEYDLDQINGMAETYGKKLYEQGLSQAQAYHNASTFATRLEIDAPKVAAKYSFLDEEGKDFNPGAADFVNRMYLKTVGYDPQTGVAQNLDVRYSEFVEGFMEVIDLVSAGKVADTSKNVARQAAQTGIRPGGVAKSKYQGDDPRQMSDEQLDQMIQQGLGIRK